MEGGGGGGRRPLQPVLICHILTLCLVLGLFLKKREGLGGRRRSDDVAWGKHCRGRERLKLRTERKNYSKQLYNFLNLR